MMGPSELAVVGLAGSGLGTAMGVPMVWPRLQREAGARLMGGWLLGVSTLVGLISLRLIGWVPAAPGIEHAINLLGLTAFPLIYLYVRQHTCASASGGAWWPWAPAAAYLIVLILRSGVGTDTRVPFAWLLPIVLGFTVACGVRVHRRRLPSGRAIVPPEWIVAFLVVLNVAQVARMTVGHLPAVQAIVPLVITGEFVAMVGLMVWRLVSANSVEPSIGQVVGPSAREPRYARSGLDGESAQVLLARIERALTVDRVFADPGLTLARLATAVDSTPHQVSEVLNRYHKTTFHELLGRHRVDDVKAQLCDPDADRYTIEGIGASAGFGSRSALYAAFRRVEGMTPAEFRARRTNSAEGCRASRSSRR